MTNFRYDVCVNGARGEATVPRTKGHPFYPSQSLSFKVIFTRIHKMYSYIENIYTGDRNIKNVVGFLCESRTASYHKSSPYSP
jgi:hypothetical protein